MLGRFRSLVAPKRSAGTLSYSQCGEDLIIDYIFRNNLRVDRSSYLDIGAHDAVALSNTYFFYCAGSAGTCVEPNPKRCDSLIARRQRDRVVNAAVMPVASNDCTYYEMSQDVLNTMDNAEAERMVREEGMQILASRAVPTVSMTDLMKPEFGGVPDLVSMDIEGIELDILKTIDFEKTRPRVFCIETIVFSSGNLGKRRTDIVEFMESIGYIAWADTHINTIFVDSFGL